MDNYEFIKDLKLMHIKDGTFHYWFNGYHYQIYVNGSRWIGEMLSYNPALANHPEAFKAITCCKYSFGEEGWISLNIHPDQVYINGEWYAMEDPSIAIDLFTAYCRHENIC